MSISESVRLAALEELIAALGAEVARLALRLGNHLDGEDVHEAVLGPPDPLAGVPKRKIAGG